MLHAKNKGADQPVQPRSLFSAFVIRSLKSTIIHYIIHVHCSPMENVKIPVSLCS